ncbi:MAG: hypothetical protein HYZ53_29610 [Planctomycetes bacterium]|nr:hypothetical protein [Planctomycetota bacterium]
MSVTDTRPRLFGQTGIQAEAALTSVGWGEGHADWDGLIDDLLRYRGLREDWDGMGASAIRPELADAAIRWLQDMRRTERAVPPSRVVPGRDGEVLLEWQGAGCYLEVEIATPDRAEWMLVVPGQAAQHQELSPLSGHVEWAR